MINENELQLTTLDLVVKGMLEKKAEDVVILDLANIQTAVTDYFVICSANSDTQADAISTAIQEEVWKANRTHAYGKEGFQQKEWILLDFGDVVAHVFRKDRREFYALEELWGDAVVVEADAEFEKALYRRLSGEPEEIKKSVEEIKVIKLAAKKSGTKKPAATVKKTAAKKASTGAKKSVSAKTGSKTKPSKSSAKSATKKSVAKKSTAKKVIAKKKTAEPKKATKKVATKKTVAKKAPATKTKTSSKKATTAKKVTAKKVDKPLSKKPATKKATKAPAKKIVKKTTTKSKGTKPKKK